SAVVASMKTQASRNVLGRWETRGMELSFTAKVARPDSPVGMPSDLGRLESYCAANDPGGQVMHLNARSNRGWPSAAKPRVSDCIGTRVEWRWSLTMDSTGDYGQETMIDIDSVWMSAVGGEEVRSQQESLASRRIGREWSNGADL